MRRESLALMLVLAADGAWSAKGAVPPPATYPGAMNLK